MVYEIGRTKAVPGMIWQRCASGQLVEARNETVSFFLDTPCEWALFVDSDMGFAPDTLEQLLGSADAKERPVVGALCFGLKRVSQDDELQSVAFRSFPTIYRYCQTADDLGFVEQIDYARDALVQCDATGAACLLVHRSVLEKIRETDGDNWFGKLGLTHPETGKGRHFSEDMSFCLRVARAGFPLWVNTAVKTSHDKGGIYYTEETFDDQLRLAKVEYEATDMASEMDFDDALTLAGPVTHRA